MLTANRCTTEDRCTFNNLRGGGTFSSPARILVKKSPTTTNIYLVSTASLHIAAFGKPTKVFAPRPNETSDTCQRYSPPSLNVNGVQMPQPVELVVCRTANCVADPGVIDNGRSFS